MASGSLRENSAFLVKYSQGQDLAAAELIAGKDRRCTIETIGFDVTLIFYHKPWESMELIREGPLGALQP